MQPILTHHAIIRFNERIRPGLDWKDAKSQLEMLVAGGDGDLLEHAAAVEKYPWLSYVAIREPPEHFMVIGDLALLINNGYAITIFSKDQSIIGKRKASKRPIRNRVKVPKERKYKHDAQEERVG